MQSLPRALATVVVTAGLALAVLAAPAQAQTWEQILDYTVDLQIEADGNLVVTEQAVLRCGTEERHGIPRTPRCPPFADADPARALEQGAAAF